MSTARQKVLKITNLQVWQSPDLKERKVELYATWSASARRPAYSARRLNPHRLRLPPPTSAGDCRVHDHRSGDRALRIWTHQGHDGSRVPGRDRGSTASIYN